MNGAAIFAIIVIIVCLFVIVYSLSLRRKSSSSRTPETVQKSPPPTTEQAEPPLPGTLEQQTQNIWTFCPRCGARIKWSPSCSECGAKIPLYDATSGEQHAADNNQYQQQLAKCKRDMWLWRLGIVARILVSLAVAAVVAGGIYWGVQHFPTSISEKLEPIPSSASPLLASPPKSNSAPAWLDQEFQQLYGHPYYPSLSPQQPGISGLESLVNNVKKQFSSFGVYYQEDYFDCSNRSTYFEYLLERKGYPTCIFTGGNHAWVMVYSTEGWVAIETTGLYLPTPSNCEDYSLYSRPERRYDDIEDVWAEEGLNSYAFFTKWWGWHETEWAAQLEKLAR
jgi:hypothetical protein